MRYLRILFFVLIEFFILIEKFEKHSIRVEQNLLKVFNFCRRTYDDGRAFTSDFKNADLRRGILQDAWYRRQFFVDFPHYFNRIVIRRKRQPCFKATVFIRGMILNIVREDLVVADINDRIVGGENFGNKYPDFLNRSAHAADGN